ADVVELLSDPTRCQVLLVTLPEETPVNELVDTAYGGEDRAGVALGPIGVRAAPPRCQVLLVALPEETPVNELVGTAYAVEDRAGVALGPIVVNQCIPPLALDGDVARDAALAGVSLGSA